MNLIHLLLLLTTSVSASQVEPNLRVSKRLMDAGVDQLVQEGLFKDGVVGILGPEQEEIWTYGKSDAHTFFEIGSITKSFTGILLGIAVVEDRVRLSDKVEAHIPDLRGTFAGTATLEQLATHMSGLPRNFCMEKGRPECPQNIDPENPYVKFEEADLYRFLRSFKPSENSPNQSYAQRYSNLGTMLLGNVLCHVYQKPFRKLLNEKILIPLEMKEMSTALLSAQPIPYFKGHNLALDPVAHFEFSDVAFPAGGLLGNAFDFMKWVKFLGNPDSSPLGKAVTLSITKLLGWDNKIEEESIWKNGGTFGFHSLVSINPKTRSVFFTFSNTEGGAVEELLKLTSNIPMTRFYGMAMSLAEKKSFTGGFEFAGPKEKPIERKVWISLSRSRLYLHDETPHGYGLLLPVGRDTFHLYDGFGRVPRTILSIDRDPAKRITGFTLIDGSEISAFKKVSAKK